MGRVVTVNAKRDSSNSADEFGIGSIAEPEDYGRDFGIAGPSAAAGGIPPQIGDQGPCLYLGPGGQRCSRRATNAGFCAIHQPDGAAAGIAKPSKKFIASVLAILAVIWPYLADVLREVIRWIHAH